jgi:hypothetical protein
MCHIWRAHVKEQRQTTWIGTYWSCEQYHAQAQCRLVLSEIRLDWLELLSICLIREISFLKAK